MKFNLENHKQRIVYFQNLMTDVMEVRKTVEYSPIDPSLCDVSYMPTKKQSFIGITSGYAQQLLRSEKGIKEVTKIRSNCRDYLKFYRTKQGKILQIEHVVNGKIDCLYQTYIVHSRCYFFPYASDGGFYPTYTYVSNYHNNNIVEEYMVHGTQLIYESYTNESTDSVDYHYINYINGGTYPILEEKKGRFLFHPLRYESIECDTWLNHRST